MLSAVPVKRGQVGRLVRKDVAGGQTVIDHANHFSPNLTQHAGLHAKLKISDGDKIMPRSARIGVMYILVWGTGEVALGELSNELT